MRFLLPLLVTVCLAGVSHAETYAYKLDIRPNPRANWRASNQDVSAVLHSAAGELYQFFPDRNLKPILVEPQGGPIVLFNRGKNGEYTVKMATGGMLWAQYSFQFAHEFCHILCRYDADKHPNKWFEESICETASLFALRRMSKTWATKPPYPNWKGYAPSLKSYADDRISSVKHFNRGTFLMWYHQHAASLNQKSDQRDKNLFIATKLLPKFERDPKLWEAVAYLNVSKGTPQQNFRQYLQAWHDNAPRKFGPFIRQVAILFGQRISTDDK